MAILPLLACVAWKRLQIGSDMLLIITSNNDKLFIRVNIDDLEWPWSSKIEVLVFFCNLCLRRRFQEWIAMGWIKIDPDNLRIGTAQAVARLMSFAQITCMRLRTFQNVLRCKQNIRPRCFENVLRWNIAKLLQMCCKIWLNDSQPYQSDVLNLNFRLLVSTNAHITFYHYNNVHQYFCFWVTGLLF